MDSTNEVEDDDIKTFRSFAHEEKSIVESTDILDLKAFGYLLITNVL